MGDVDRSIWNVEDEIRNAAESIVRVEEETRQLENEIVTLTEQIGTCSAHHERETLELRESRLRDEKVQLWVDLRQLWVDLRQLRVDLRRLREEALTRRVDRSEEWIKFMLLPELPELPRNKAELTNVLFPPGHIQKLPVTKEFYWNQKVNKPVLVEQHLIEADGSKIPTNVSCFLYLGSAEMNMTLIVAASLFQFFSSIHEHTENNIPLNLAWRVNCTEEGVDGHSATTALRSRPDTILTAFACTLLVVMFLA